MAQNKTSTGGNTPKPANTAGGGAGQTAKDRSRAQSRPVSAKAQTTKVGKASGGGSGGGGGGGGGNGGNRPRPGGKPAPASQPRRFSGAMMAWGAVGLVIVIVVVLVVVKATGGNSTDTKAYTPVTPAPASIVHDVTTIPTSVFDKVGITSTQVPVNPPIVLSNQPALSIKGKSPAMLYLGAEYCPYCAAERWAMTVALSRFGTWSHLKITASSHTDMYPATHTFSFHGATLTSPYLTFASIEELSNVPTASGSYTALEQPTKEEQQIISTYSDPKYITGATAGQVAFPFINIGNKVLISGASYSPGVLANLSWSDIAGNLDDPTNPVTAAIVTTANYMTAAICASTKNAPAAVCSSSGVQAAAKALKLS